MRHFVLMLAAPLHTAKIFTIQYGVGWIRSNSKAAYSKPLYFFTKLTQSTPNGTGMYFPIGVIKILVG